MYKLKLRLLVARVNQLEKEVRDLKKQSIKNKNAKFCSIDDQKIILKRKG